MRLASFGQKLCTAQSASGQWAPPQAMASSTSEASATRASSGSASVARISSGDHTKNLPSTPSESASCAE